MRNQYPVVLLGYAGETTRPESHGRSRSHMNSNILMFYSVHTPSDLVFLMTHFTPDLFCCLQPLPAASDALCCLQCVPHRGQVPIQDMAPYRTCLQKLVELLAPCKGRSCLVVSCSAGWPVFFLCKISKGENKDNKVSGEIPALFPGECHLPVATAAVSPNSRALPCRYLHLSCCSHSFYS